MGTSVKQIRHRMFREMVGNVRRELRERGIQELFTMSTMRLLWQTANNCAEMHRVTLELKAWREEYFR